MSNKLVAAFLGVAALVLSPGCADVASGVTSAVLDKALEEGPPTIEADFRAAVDLNPDHEGNPSPLVVRLYELKSATAFNNSGFFSLYDNDSAELGDDLKGREEIEFQPGQALFLERELEMETRYLGVIAAYRDIENARWRAVIEVEPGSDTEVIIALERLAVNINEDDSWF
jgi:type VI secretion system protein VasD